MALVIPTVGELELLQILVNKNSPTSLILGLYSNNYVPDQTSQISNVTSLSGGGYSSATLTGAGWTTSSPGGAGTISYSNVTFTFSGAQTIYGWYITNTDGDLLMLQRFSGGPYSIPADGGKVILTPVLTLD